MLKDNVEEYYRLYKVKKFFYKWVWFWVLVVIVIFIVGGLLGGKDNFNVINNVGKIISVLDS